eukprot:7131711-Prymnesium_polylepis.1
MPRGGAGAKRERFSHRRWECVHCSASARARGRQNVAFHGEAALCVSGRQTRRREWGVFECVRMVSSLLVGPVGGSMSCRPEGRLEMEHLPIRHVCANMVFPTLHLAPGICSAGES